MSDAGKGAIYNEIRNWRTNRDSTAVVVIVALLSWAAFLIVTIYAPTYPALAGYRLAVLMSVTLFGAVVPFFYFRWEYRVAFFADKILLRFSPFSGETVRLADVARVDRIPWGGLSGPSGALQGRPFRAYRLFGRTGVGLSLRDGTLVVFEAREPETLVAAIRALLPLRSG